MYEVGRRQASIERLWFFFPKKCQEEVAKGMLANIANDSMFIKWITKDGAMWAYLYDVKIAQQSSESRVKNVVGGEGLHFFQKM